MADVRRAPAGRMAIRPYRSTSRYACRLVVVRVRSVSVAPARPSPRLTGGPLCYLCVESPVTDNGLRRSVCDVALLFYQTAQGVAYEVYEETLFGHTIVTFRYLQISLARLAPQAYDYLHTGNILAIALASIMGRSLRGPTRPAILRLLATAAGGRASRGGESSDDAATGRGDRHLPAGQR